MTRPDGDILAARTRSTKRSSPSMLSCDDLLEVEPIAKRPKIAEVVRPSTTKLADIPTDCLEIVTRHLGPFGTQNMYECGDTQLNRKLVHGGVTRLDYDTQGRSKSRFAFLVWFGRHLRELAFNVNTSQFTALMRILPRLTKLTKLDIVWAQMQDFCVDLLPRSITVLKLVDCTTLTGDCVYGLPPNLLVLDAPRTLLSERHIARLPATLRKLHTYLLTPSQLALLPPNLHSLEFRLCSDEGARMPRHGIYDLSFPPGLMSLSVTNYGDVEVCASDLPRGLTSLISIGSGRIIAPSVHYFPPALRTFVGTIDPTMRFPSSLTAMRCCVNRYHDRYRFFDTLPASLRALQLSVVPNVADSSAFENMPPGLEKLDLFWPASHGELGRVIDMLPRNLSWLRIADREAAINDETLANLPPALTHLELDGTDLITDAGIASLPRTLRTLELPDNSHCTDDCFATLPPSLTRLYLQEHQCDPGNPIATCRAHELPPSVVAFQGRDERSRPIRIAQ